MAEKMIKFGIVDAEAREVRREEHKDLVAAMASVGLERGKIDHGALGGGVSIVVYEFGLKEPTEHHFSLGRQLFAGSAVVYQCDEMGDTVDFVRHLPAVFYLDRDKVERCIDLGLLDRPQMSINGEVF